MPQVPARSLAALLGVKPKRAQSFTALDLSREVDRGLPASAVDSVCAKVAPGDMRLRHRIVPKATLARRQRATQRRLSSEESNRLARLARLWAFAIDVWRSDAAAQRFLAEPHPLLRGRIPRELAIESDVGARAVEDLLGGLKFGTAV
jgi:putative toxin-antitoxin system antitoxin component (TIGR02293 family)